MTSKEIVCSALTDSKIPLLKTMFTQLNKHGEVKLVPTWNLHLHVLVSLARKSAMQVTKSGEKATPQPENM